MPASNDPGAFDEPDILFEELSARVGTSSGRVTVAVLDTAFELGHPAFEGRVLENASEVPGDALDNDGNGLIDDFAGWDFAAGDPDVSPVYESWGSADLHGTHTAGLATQGTDQLLLLPVRAYDVQAEGSEVLSGGEVAQAIDYSAARGARVVNLSFSADTESAALILEAMARHPDVLFVLAAGNEGRSLEEGACAEGAVYCPLVTELPNVVLVAAADADGAPADYSNFGERQVTLAARGTDVRSSIPGRLYADESGTSMAAPLAANLAAKCLALDEGLTPASLRALLIATSSPSPAWEQLVAAGGPLDARRAMLLAALSGLLRRGMSPGAAAKRLGLSGTERGEMLAWAAALHSGS